MKKKFFKKVLHNAFTLAEILITLTIIGIVAALTIPTLITKNQEHAFRSAFLKNYAIIKQANSLAERNDEGFYGEAGWDWISSHYYYNPELIKKYFKVVKGPFHSTNGQGRWSLLKFYPQYSTYEDISNNIKWLNGQPSNYFINDTQFVFQVEDGTIISFHITNCHANTIFIDVNGAKGPNTFGKDIYSVEYTDLGYPPASPISHNPGAFNQIMPSGSLGTQGCGGGLYWTVPETDCKKSGEGRMCSYEILKDRNYKIPG